MEPAPAYAANLMQDAAEGLTGDPLAKCILIVERRGSEDTRGYSTVDDVQEIRGMMFRAASALPTT